MNPHPLKQREQDLMQFYSYCQLGMTPKQFYTKWQVNYEEMAQICDRSLSTCDAGLLEVKTTAAPCQPIYTTLH